MRGMRFDGKESGYRSVAKTYFIPLLWAFVFSIPQHASIDLIMLYYLILVHRDVGA